MYCTSAAVPGGSRNAAPFVLINIGNQIFNNLSLMNKIKRFRMIFDPFMYPVQAEKLSQPNVRWNIFAGFETPVAIFREGTGLLIRKYSW
jgi:hypothetical protein